MIDAPHAKMEAEEKTRSNRLIYQLKVATWKVAVPLAHL